MRSNDPRRPYVAHTDTAISYHHLHVCPTCSSVLQLDVIWRPVNKELDPKDGRWWVVTACKCGPYSTEAGAYTSKASALRKRRQMLAGIEAVEPEPEPEPISRPDNDRYVYLVYNGAYPSWRVQFQRNGKRVEKRCNSREAAIAWRDEQLGVAA